VLSFPCTYQRADDNPFEPGRNKQTFMQNRGRGVPNPLALKGSSFDLSTSGQTALEVKHESACELKVIL
jgi:hypothetical protein